MTLHDIRIHSGIAGGSVIWTKGTPDARFMVGGSQGDYALTLEWLISGNATYDTAKSLLKRVNSHPMRPR